MRKFQANDFKATRQIRSASEEGVRRRAFQASGSVAFHLSKNDVQIGRQCFYFTLSCQERRCVRQMILPGAEAAHSGMIHPLMGLAGVTDPAS